MKLRPLVPLISLALALPLAGCNMDGSSDNTDNTASGTIDNNNDESSTDPLVPNLPDTVDTTVTNTAELTSEISSASEGAVIGLVAGGNFADMGNVSINSGITLVSVDSDGNILNSNVSTFSSRTSNTQATFSGKTCLSIESANVTLSNVNFNNIEMMDCGSEESGATSRAIINIGKVHPVILDNITIDGADLTETTGSSDAWIYSRGQVTITNSRFVNKSDGAKNIIYLNCGSSASRGGSNTDPTGSLIENNSFSLTGTNTSGSMKAITIGVPSNLGSENKSCFATVKGNDFIGFNNLLSENDDDSTALHDVFMNEEGATIEENNTLNGVDPNTDGDGGTDGGDGGTDGGDGGTDGGDGGTDGGDGGTDGGDGGTDGGDGGTDGGDGGTGGGNASLSLPAGILTPPTVNCTEVFDSTSKLEDAVSKEMEAGTTLCLADGEYQDLEITYGGAGTEDDPIKVAAQNPGQAVITGDVKIIMGGQYTQLQGLVFDGGNSSSSNLISTRFGTGDLCTHCRITEIAIVNIDTNEGITDGDTSSGEWVNIYGQNNWLDHSILSGKTTASPMVSLVRWVDSSWSDEDKQAELAKNIIVYNNYFGNRAPAQGKMYASNNDNNYEAIRTGLSDTHHYDGNSIIMNNLFEQIDGEAEVISNKGTNNMISHNTIRNSYGSLTTRHGNSAVIEGNFILGEGNPFSGGLRIVDGNHSITNNYIEGARYKDTTHHGGIVILGSDGSGDGDNGYQQVANVHIAHNTIVDSVNSLNIDGGGKSKQPNTVYLANNVIAQAIGPVITQAERGLPASSTIEGNIIYGQSFSDDDAVPQGTSGFDFRSPMLLKVEGEDLYRPTGFANLDAMKGYFKGDFADVLVDMDGQLRSELTMAGADEMQSSDVVQHPLTYDDVGPVNYRLNKPTPIINVVNIENPAFDNGFESWSYNNVAMAAENETFSRNTSAELDGGEAYLSQDITLIPNTRYAVSAFVKGPVEFEIDGIGNQTFDESDNDYKWVNWEFNSGYTEHTTLTLSLADNIPLYAEIEDNQLSDFRANSGKSDFWITHEGNDGGLGDVGSSGDTAFGDSGSARIRFRSADDDFSVTPGLSQFVSGLKTNTDYTFSLYYYDNKKDSSPSHLHFGVKTDVGESLQGSVIVEDIVHVKDLDDRPQGSVKTGFRQVEVSFNTGENTDVEIFALMQIDQTQVDNIKAQSDIGKATEVRVDEFALSYQGAPEEGTMGYFDDIRLINRINPQ